MEAITIEPVTKRILVLPLLLEADPSRESVVQYLRNGECYAATSDGKILGVYVLQRTQPFTMELMNVVVQEIYQKLGVGNLLLTDAIARARNAGARTLEVGVSNSNISALAFYQQLGFRMRCIEAGYFERFYPEPFEENGILRRDRVKLCLHL